MAEDGIEGPLGEDKGSAEGEIGAAAADGVAMMVAMDAAKSNVQVAASVLKYLEKQSRLVDLQRPEDTVPSKPAGERHLCRRRDRRLADGNLSESYDAGDRRVAG
jgi:hypothetical protein